jgi:hypothetical protein
MTSDPPPEFVHDTAHLLRALEKEGLVETRVGPDGQLQYRATAKLTKKAFKRVAAAVEAELDALDTDDSRH